MDEGRGETVSELLKVGKGWGGGGGGETPLYRLESLSGNSSLLHAIFGTQINSYRMTLLARKLYFTSCFSSEVTELIVLSMP